MKHLYIITKYVEAESAEAALKLDRRTPASEVELHMPKWEANSYKLKEEPVIQKTIGFKGK